MDILGIVGAPGSGKTTLIVALLPVLRAAGLSVSTINFVPGGLDLDQPGKDSDRHRLAGAHEVLVASSRRWALLHQSGPSATSLPDLLTRMEPVDLVLVEGAPDPAYAGLEVYRPSLGRPPLWPREPKVVAVASNTTIDTGVLPLLPLDVPGAIAGWIRRCFVTIAPSGS